MHTHICRWDGCLVGAWETAKCRVMTEKQVVSLRPQIANLRISDCQDNRPVRSCLLPTHILYIVVLNVMDLFGFESRHWRK